MGFGMAAMAVPATVFTLPAVDLAAVRCRVRRGRTACPVGRAQQPAPSAPPGGHGGDGLHGGRNGRLPGQYHAHSGAGVPLLTGVLLLYFTGYVLLAGVRLVPVAAPGGTGSVRWGDRPELARACLLCMGIGMVAMLLTL